MKKEEFEKLMQEEQAKGMKAVGLAMSHDELIKISVAMSMADRIIGQVGDNASKEKDMELIALCLLAQEGIDMVERKFLIPIMDQVEGKKDKKEDE